MQFVEGQRVGLSILWEEQRSTEFGLGPKILLAALCFLASHRAYRQRLAEELEG